MLAGVWGPPRLVLQTPLKFSNEIMKQLSSDSDFCSVTHLRISKISGAGGARGVLFHFST